jgi:hypothetical protein
MQNEQKRNQERIVQLERLVALSTEENTWILDACHASNAVIEKLVQLNDEANERPELEAILAYFKK